MLSLFLQGHSLTLQRSLCSYRDILCGLLQCSGGDREPLFLGADKGYSTTTISDGAVSLECKSVHGPAMMDMPHMGLVQDGTRCRLHHVCRRNRCVPLPYVPVLSCPATNHSIVCSGHGVSFVCVCVWWLFCVCVFGGVCVLFVCVVCLVCVCLHPGVQLFGHQPLHRLLRAWGQCFVCVCK